MYAHQTKPEERMAKHLHETFPFLLNRIAARVTDAVNREFRPLGLNVFGARVLILLFLDDARTVGELAERAALDQSTLSHILRRLEGLGYLSKERQEHDNRSVMVSLTQKGRRTGEACWNAVQTHDALLTKGLDGARKHELKEVLDKMYENVPAFQEGGRRNNAPAVKPRRSGVKPNSKAARG